VFATIRLPDGAFLRLLDKRLHLAALETAGRKLAELRHGTGNQERG